MCSRKQIIQSIALIHVSTITEFIKGVQRIGGVLDLFYWCNVFDLFWSFSIQFKMFDVFEFIQYIQFQCAQSTQLISFIPFVLNSFNVFNGFRSVFVIYIEII